MSQTQVNGSQTNTVREIAYLEKSAEDSIKSASDILSHYLGLAIGSLTSDNRSEIEGILHTVADAAVARAKAEILRRTLPVKH